MPDTILVCRDKVLAKSPQIVFYDQSRTINRTKAWEPYTGLHGIFPEERIICDDDGFIFSPFEYDADSRELIFTPTIIIDRILVSEEEADNSSLSDNTKENIDELVNLICFQGNRDFTLNGFK